MKTPAESTPCLNGSTPTEPFLLGLTGLYCAGKNYVAALLEKRGVPVLDVDRLGHAALETEKAALVRRFGEAALAPDGSVSRRFLAARVFGRPEELAALEAIVHPAADALTEAWIKTQGGQGRSCCAVNAALIHRSAVFGRLDALLVVRAPFFLRLYRAKKRDRLPLGELLRRFLRQRRFSAQYFSSSADRYIIGNSGCSGSGKRLEKRLDKILDLAAVLRQNRRGGKLRDE